VVGAKPQRDIRLIKEIAPRQFLWYSFTDETFIMLDQNNHSEDKVTIKGVDPNTTADIIMHPGMFQGLNPYAVVINHPVSSGIREIKQIKIVPGEQKFPYLTRYRTSTKQYEVSTPTGDNSDASDTMVVMSVCAKASNHSHGTLEYFVEKQIYASEYLEALPGLKQ